MSLCKSCLNGLIEYVLVYIRRAMTCICVLFLIKKVEKDVAIELSSSPSCQLEFEKPNSWAARARFEMSPSWTCPRARLILACLRAKARGSHKNSDQTITNFKMRLSNYSILYNYITSTYLHYYLIRISFIIFITFKFQFY